MSTRKYYGDLGGIAHGGLNLNWPGTPDGFPVVGEPGNIKQQELEEAELQLDFRSRMFLLWDDQHKAAFDEISDRIVNGWYRLMKRNDTWDDEHKHYRVWLEWAQVYGLIPTKKS
jgi:hypothetical protein